MADKDNEEKGAQLVATLATLGLGGLLGALATLFTSRPAKAAPDTEWLQYIATLLEQLNTTEADVLGAIKSLSLGGGAITPGEISLIVSTPWIGKDPVLIFQQDIRNAGTFQSDDLIDFRNGKRLVFKVESSLDQNAIIQVVANTTKTFQLATNVNGPFPCQAGGNIHIGLAWGDWLSYIGVVITIAVAPTRGMLNIWSVMQE